MTIPDNKPYIPNSFDISFTENQEQKNRTIDTSKKENSILKELGGKSRIFKLFGKEKLTPGEIYKRDKIKTALNNKLLEFSEGMKTDIEEMKKLEKELKSLEKGTGPKTPKREVSKRENSGVYGFAKEQADKKEADAAFEKRVKLLSGTKLEAEESGPIEEKAPINTIENRKKEIRKQIDGYQAKLKVSMENLKKLKIQFKGKDVKTKTLSNLEKQLKEINKLSGKIIDKANKLENPVIKQANKDLDNFARESFFGLDENDPLTERLKERKVELKELVKNLEIDTGTRGKAQKLLKEIDKALGTTTRLSDRQKRV